MKIGHEIQEDDDIWDDTLVIKAYEQSIKLQQAEAAKRIARATNKKQQLNDSDEVRMERVESSESESQEFKVGDFVRATYDEDSIDYEATIETIDDNGNCLIKFIGYNNEQTTAIEDLLPSWGPNERAKQAAQADEANQENDAEEVDEGVDEGFASNVTSMQFSSVIPPPPMPPMPTMMNDGNVESEHMSAMLMSWYMSGYYTGYYQGHKMATRNKRGAQKKRK